MQLPDLSRIRSALEYEEGSGRFIRRVGNGKCPRGSEAGTVRRNGYRVISIDGRPMLAHRLAWLLRFGAWPAGELDHINGDKLDNRIVNLRLVDRVTNLQNRRAAQANNRSSGVLGVTWNKRAEKWQAQIKVGDRVRYLGLFTDVPSASAAYVHAKRRFHAGCTI